MLAFISAHSADIIAVIVLLVVGPAVGNYACSVVYRLPRGQTPFEKHPYCGHCGTMLQPIDLFPILSFLLTKGKCRYCSGVIPAVYTVIEIACAAIFIGYYFAFGMGEAYIIYTAVAVFIVMMAAIGWGHQYVSSFLYTVTVLLLLLSDVLRTGSMFPALQLYGVFVIVGLAFYALCAKWRRMPVAIGDANVVWWCSLLALVVPTPFAIWFGYSALMVVFLAAIATKRVAVYVGIPCVIVTMIAAVNLV